MCGSRAKTTQLGLGLFHLNPYMAGEIEVEGGGDPRKIEIQGAGSGEKFQTTLKYGGRGGPKIFLPPPPRHI